MVIDPSAILAILLNEPERRAFNEAIEAAETRVMSAATFFEVSMVIESRYGAEGLRDLDVFLERAGVELAAVDPEQSHVARRAFSRFGKGRHRAGLNYGTASPTLSRRCSASRSSTRAKTSAILTSRRFPPSASSGDRPPGKAACLLGAGRWRLSWDHRRPAGPPGASFAIETGRKSSPPRNGGRISGVSSTPRRRSCFSRRSPAGRT